MLLNYLLKSLSSSEFKKNVDDACVGPTMENVLADWKPIILKLYNKEPELLLNLLKDVLHMIETQADMKCGEGRHQFFSPTTLLLMHFLGFCLALLMIIFL